MVWEDLRSKLDGHFRIEFGASFLDLREGETRFVTTARRDARRFAGYFLPVWFARQGNKCIVSISPELQSRVESVFNRFTAKDIFSKKGFCKAANLAEAIGGSIDSLGPYFYNSPDTFKPYKCYEVTELKESDRDIFVRHEDWFGPFNGYWNESKRNTRVFTIFESQIPISTAYTMSKSIYAWEVAVWTRQEYRRRGYGKTVVTAAVEAIFTFGKLSVYCTSWENIASRRLAESLGFQFYCESYAIKTAAQEIQGRTDRYRIAW